MDRRRGNWTLPLRTPTVDRVYFQETARMVIWKGENLEISFQSLYPKCNQLWEYDQMKLTLK